VLLAAALVALVWANSPFSGSYDRLWSTRIVVSGGGFAIREDLRYWANEGLMALFFLVAGLEIKREFLTGELRDRRAALLPVVAAAGGMAVPALIYLALNAGGAGARGWGVAMPTDLAFALGILALASRNAPPGLKPLVLTLAIVDDIGTIVVIALFYSGGIRWAPLALAGTLAVAILVVQRIHVRSGAVYAALGVGIWLAMQRSGVHPALAGVVVGLLTPAFPFQRPHTVSREAHRVADETVDDPSPPDADSHHWLRLSWLSREAVSPLGRIEHVLLPWVSFLVLPLFALANAGVRLTGGGLHVAIGSAVFAGIVLGRLVGKVVGITLAVWLLVRTGVARLPAGATWRHVVGIGCAASVPFTVSLFVAGLALPPSLDAVARVGIIVSAIAGGLLGYLVLRSPRAPRALSPGSAGRVR
jgi:NhaA family Na+:H+ antiporter